MKKFILFFLLFSKVILAQESNDKIIYLDSLHNETTQGNHKYYRIIKDYSHNQKEYFITQYYASGKIESDGVSTNKDFFNKKGLITTYYENSNKKSLIYYDEKTQNGKCKFWYENGEKKLEGEFLVHKENDKQVSILKVDNFWTSDKTQTVVNGNGDYIDDGDLDYIENNSISRGKIINGFKDGLWIGSNKKPEFSFEENYADGKLISGTSTDKNNNKFKYSVVNKTPESINGINGFLKYVMKNFKVPDKPGIKGKVYTKFVIESNGNIKDLKTIKSLEPSIDLEAIRIIKNYKDFSPAELRGIKIESTYILPISIETPTE